MLLIEQMGRKLLKKISQALYLKIAFFNYEFNWENASVHDTFKSYF